MTDLVLNCKGDSKKLYTLVSKLTGSVKDNPLPSAENDENLANEFADYFVDKIIQKLETLYPMFQITVLVKQILQCHHLNLLSL